MIRAAALYAAALLAACATPLPTPLAPPPAEAPIRPDAATAARNFTAVVAALEPVAERECRARAPRLDCDFRILVDDRPGQPPNAFQTLDAAGRPVIGFTLALIAETRNRDELAFVLGHETAHHIAGHLARTQGNALAGALVFGTLAALTGAPVDDVRAAQDLGATVGARSYSKDFELEADALGTVIAWRAGFDPARGAEFFTRVPDPGNRFLGTHPPNSARRAIVLQTLATLR
ncbi:MAG: M48 family metallopeptidase [Paracoccaceae bacterium]|nr:M48 family metallopeptidase [Paracoccaceae bacterium]